MIFENAAARDGYLPHPEHVRVKEFIGTQIAPDGTPTCVMDFDV
jgi:hypothetical protein